MAARLKVTYQDGRSVDVTLPPRIQMEAEAALGGLSERNMLAALYRMAWLALFKSGQERADFDTWLDLIDDVQKIVTPERDPAEAEAPDPTPSAPSPDGSSG